MRFHSGLCSVQPSLSHPHRAFLPLAVAACSLAAISAATPLLGQGAQGTILGHVTDSSGAVVSGASVSIKNVATGVVNSFRTGGTGDYVVPNLNPGNYTVSVQATGFKDSSSAGLLLQVDQTLRQNFSLAVGNDTESVTVTSDSQMLQTDNATNGQVIEGSLIENLPSNGRDFTNLLQIGVGTTTTPGGVQNAGFSLHGLNPNFQQVSINGAHSDSISYNIDGVYDSDFFFSSPANIPGELSVQEFKTLNGQYGAQYGAGSAQVNVAIKSGTNQFHGAAYEFLQNDFFNPDNETSKAKNLIEGTNLPVRSPFKQNQFGGIFGGPVLVPHVYNGRDKTFFFIAYDGGREHIGTSPTAFITPSKQQLAGNFSDWPYPIYDPQTTGSVAPTANNPTGRTAFAGNIIPTGRLNSVAQAYLPFFQTPNVNGCTNLTTGCDNFTGQTLNTTRTDLGTLRVDENLNSNDHIFFTGNMGNDSQTSPSLKYGQGNSLFQRSRLFGLSWSHTFNPNVINQATAGYTREHFFSGPTTANGANLTSTVGLANGNANPITYDLPQTCFFQYACIGGGSPTVFFDNIYQIADTLTVITGRHTLNMGIDLRRVQAQELDDYGATGSLNFNGQYTASNPTLAGNALTASGGSASSSAPYQGNSFADFILGQPNSASGPAPIASDQYTVWGNNYNLFFQDDLRATDRLTLNLGLRWERPGNFSSNTGSGYAFNPSNGGSLTWASRSFVTPLLAAGGNPNYLGCCSSKTLVPIDKKDFAPRIGFAYRPDLFGDKAVIRGGYGIFYDTYTRYYDFSQYDTNALYTQFATVYNPTTGNETQSTTPLNTLWAPPETSAQFFTTPSYNFALSQVNWPFNHNPYNQQWSLDIQYALTPTLLLDTAYVGSHGLHESTQIYINAGFAPRVANDSCNSLKDVSQATGSNAKCLTDPNFQPIDTRVPYPNLSNGLYANANFFNSSYNSLQVQLIQRTVHGLQYHVNYTYSKSMDISSGINNINGEPGIIQNPHNPSTQYGLSASDQTHRAVATYSYELPAGHGKRLDVKNFNWLVGGWTTSGIYTLASGFPFSINGGVSTDQMGPNAGVYLANYTGQRTPGFKRTLSQYFDTAKYSTPLLGTYGTTNKSPERGPYYTNFDASFGKTTKITESQSFLLRCEIFNVASTWHSNPYTVFPDATVTNGSQFGSLLGDPLIGNANLFTPHRIQLGAQYNF